LEEELRRAQRSKKAELNGASHYYKEVFDNISVCMFFLEVTPDQRFKYSKFNPAEEKVVGLTTADISGKFVENVFSAELSKKLLGNYGRCLMAGAPITYADELDLPAGKRHFHTNLIPLRDESGRIDRMVGACIDTTDFKKSQEEALAGQKLESLGLLARGVAHDFNNLLSGILAQVEYAEMELDSDSPARPALQHIRSVAVRASEIVRQLMVYSGRDEFNFEQVDLSALVEEMLELLKMSISKKAALVVEIPKNLPYIWANPVQIRQVVMNLITNASEALGDKEGVIRVTLGPSGTAHEPCGDKTGRLNTGHLRLEVSDTGCGMTPAVLDRIFDPFFTTKLVGRGLGLAAVQGIIRGHAGSIHVHSVPGQGSRFEIQLPCRNVAA
jgi:PAS domain S-box-containing protein